MKTWFITFFFNDSFKAKVLSFFAPYISLFVAFSIFFDVITQLSFASSSLIGRMLFVLCDPLKLERDSLLLANRISSASLCLMANLEAIRTVSGIAIFDLQLE